jgi:hypothetical protein
LADLKVCWGVSLKNLICRARTPEISTASQYRSSDAQLVARGWRVREPIAVGVTRPRTLRQLAELLYGRPISAVQLAEDMGLTLRFVQEILEAYATGGEVTAPADPGEPCPVTHEACHLWSAAQGLGT